MRQEISGNSVFTPAQRRQILVAIRGAVRRASAYSAPPDVPQYPDAVPDIAGHIDQLVRVVRKTKPEAHAAEIVKQSCPACPHQYPSRYCPLRPRGGCVLYRCAAPIAKAVAITLDEMDRKNRPVDPAGDQVQ